MFKKTLLYLGLLASLAAHAAGLPVKIGVDAEFGHKTSTSAQAVEQGIQIAIDEINQGGGVLGGLPLELVKRDNRAITAIGKDNLRELAALPDMVAVFGGKFSPVYVECLPVAHELGILLLDPWGSADLITDHTYRPSYTFRLSLKDAWAAPAMLAFAKDTYRADSVGVLLPNTAWGRSNQAALQQNALRQNVKLVGERWYNWGDTSLLRQYQDLRAAGAQVIVLIANEVEGAMLVRELAGLPAAQRLPIVSHWGITGGQFAHLAGDALTHVQLTVIQTFSFMNNDSPVARRVLAAARRLYGIENAAQMHSPVGVAQAYDLTHLLARAINKAGSTDRKKIRDAMEQLGPYQGLVQKYAVPFTPQRHEALSPANIIFTRYTDDDQLIPFKKGKPTHPRVPHSDESVPPETGLAQ